MKNLAWVMCIVMVALAAGCSEPEDQTAQGHFGRLLIKQLHAEFDGKPLDGPRGKLYSVRDLVSINKDEELNQYTFNVNFVRADTTDHAYQWRIRARRTGEWRLERIEVQVQNDASGDVRVAALTGNARNAEMTQRIEDAFNRARSETTSF